jgi:hypothetical protein
MSRLEGAIMRHPVQRGLTQPKGQTTPPLTREEIDGVREELFGPRKEIETPKPLPPRRPIED